MHDNARSCRSTEQLSTGEGKRGCFPRLVKATPEQRSNWRFTGGGIGIHWEELDEDLSVAGLLKGERLR